MLLCAKFYDHTHKPKGGGVRFRCNRNTTIPLLHATCLAVQGHKGQPNDIAYKIIHRTIISYSEKLDQESWTLSWQEN